MTDTVTDETEVDATSEGDQNGEVVAMAHVLEPPIPLADCFLPDRLKFPRKRLSHEEWLHLGENLNLIGNGYQWWWGDWMLKGEEWFGEEAFDAVPPDMFADPKTLSNWRWMSSVYADPADRIEGASWSHHREAAELTDVKDRRKLLRRAVREGLTSREVRQMVKAMKGDIIDVDEVEAEHPVKNHRTLTISWTVWAEDEKVALKVRDDLVAMLEGAAEERGFEITKLTATES